MSAKSKSPPLRYAGFGRLGSPGGQTNLPLPFLTGAVQPPVAILQVNSVLLWLVIRPGWQFLCGMLTAGIVPAHAGGAMEMDTVIDVWFPYPDVMCLHGDAPLRTHDYG